MTSFTGVSDVDAITLLNLDDQSLSHVCQTNSYVRSICDNDEFWMAKIESRGFPMIKCQGCTSFRDTYFYYLKYMHDHGFVIIFLDVNSANFI